MKRELINDITAEDVIGGSIVFNAAHTTCGRNRNDQYKVLNYDAIINYIIDHRKTMTEKTMISNMLAAGYITEL